MNREDIIKLAREAGFTNPERFDTADETLQGLLSDFWKHLERFAALVVAAAKAEEREACAMVCEAQRNIEWVRANIPLITHDPANTMASKCAAAIRARGNT